MNWNFNEFSSSLQLPNGRQSFGLLLSVEWHIQWCRDVSFPYFNISEAHDHWSDVLFWKAAGIVAAPLPQHLVQKTYRRQRFCGERWNWRDNSFSPQAGKSSFCGLHLQVAACGHFFKPCDQFLLDILDDSKNWNFICWVWRVANSNFWWKLPDLSVVFQVLRLIEYRESCVDGNRSLKVQFLELLETPGLVLVLYHEKNSHT